MCWPSRIVNSPAGFTLVELLVSMLLGIVLGAVIIGAYLGSKRQYYYGQQVARIQENGRYAMRLLSRELGMAGFFGGVLSMDAVDPVTVEGDCGAGHWAMDARRYLDFVNDDSGESTPRSVSGRLLTCLENAGVQPATDMLAVKRSAAQASVRSGVPAAQLTPSAVEKWYLQVSASAGSRWQLRRSQAFVQSADTDAASSYWEAVSRIFFVRRYSAQIGDAIPSLCMKTLVGTAMTTRCLVEGVENMQLEFGIDTDSDGIANRYMATPGAAEFERTVAVRVHLLLRSIRPLAAYQNDKTYVLGQETLPAAEDAYLRRVFSTTVPLRNVVRPLG